MECLPVHISASGESAAAAVHKGGRKLTFKCYGYSSRPDPYHQKTLRHGGNF